MGKCKTLIQRYPFFIFGFVMLLKHCFLSPFGDDIWFAKEIADSPWAFAYKRYMQWSSRVFTDALLYWLTKLPVLWWRLADSLVITILARNLYRIICKCQAKFYTVCCHLPVKYRKCRKTMQDGSRFPDTTDAVGLYGSRAC